MNETVATRIVVEVERATAGTDEVCALIGELDRELSEHYPPEQQHGLSLDAIFQPHVRFFVARMNGIAVGCGGVALFPNFAEVKRMYVHRDKRGRGVADAIIGRLIAETRDAGLNLLRLETGTRQLAAIRFYERCGFEVCGAFAPYSSMPPEAIAESVFMEKRLAVT